MSKPKSFKEQLQPVQNSIMESDIEKAYCKYAKERGCQTVKFIDPARRGAPDRLTLLPKGKVLFIEFKAPLGVIEPHQIAYHQSLAAIGFRVHVCDTVREACHVLDCLLKI